MTSTTRGARLLQLAVAALVLPHIAFAAEPTAGPAEDTSSNTAAASVDEIVVTARRREESAQSTPIALSVLSDAQIREQGVVDIKTLTTAVPGVNFTQSSTAGNTIFSIRGMSRGVAGNAQPAVATYVNEVPLITWGNNVPTYDMASVQVLKGPQGTLFGRNTTAGAVLLSSKQPTHDFETYADGIVGSYDWRQVDAAINVPFAGDVFALRIAGQYAERDGYTKNMTEPDKDLNDIDRQSVRASLLIQPFDALKNVTIYEWTDYNEYGTGTPLNEYIPGGTMDLIPWASGGTIPTPAGDFSFAGVPASDIRAAIARQQAAGPYKMWMDFTPYTKRRMTSWINTTTYDLGFATLKNIYGYRRVSDNSISNVDGYDAPVITPLPLVHIKQQTEELNLSGSSFNDTLDWIVGGFYLKQEPSGVNRLALQAFGFPGTPVDATPNFASPLFPFDAGAIGNGDYYYDRSIAGYGQVSYDLSALSTAMQGFKVDLGMRYTKDKERACSIGGQFEANPPLPADQCPSSENVRADSKKLTYTLGLDYQATDSTLIYGVTRRGYRAGGANLPKLGGTLVPFQTYQPETVTDLELGLKHNWSLGDWTGRFNLAAYVSKYKDLIASITTASANPAVGPDGDGNPANDPSIATFYANAGKATVQGVELEITANLSNDLQLSLGGAYIDKKIDSLDVALPSTLGLTYTKKDVAAFAFNGAPDYSVNASVRYRLPLDESLGDIAVRANAFRMGPVAYGGAVSADAWNRLDLRADWNDVMQSGVDVGVFVTNVLDKTAITGGSLNSPGFGATSVLDSEPRIYGVQLAYRYGE